MANLIVPNLLNTSGAYTTSSNSTIGTVYVAASGVYQFTINPHMNAVLNSSLLLKLNKQGRNVLVYIIDHQLTYPPAVTDGQLGNDKSIYLDSLVIANYLGKFVPLSQANTVNVKRGIKNLIDNQVLTPVGSNRYKINESLVKHV